MRTLTKEDQNRITPKQALKILQEGNLRFVNNLKINRNLLQQVNQTQDGQHPFAVVLSCMDSRTSAELIFDQGLGDLFSIRIAGNIVNNEILGSAEFGCKVIESKILVVLGHTGCGAIKGAIADVELGHLRSVTSKIQRCFNTNSDSFKKLNADSQMAHVTVENVKQSIKDIRQNSKILRELEQDGKIIIVGGMYDISTGIVEFFAQE